ncbi:hypothetical protein [Halapricum desulfuricans]|uniref:Uncharacterized protein n=1 Tax=Halapricum desulfuricans TaxID=2841257 RepID=A0A897P0F2_9EURY|nr:hypothetical protein [Halapricum desulfuricans]QSG16309.1 hypothetical protein HSEST_3045 [Halapricum desulfuricans]
MYELTYEFEGSGGNIQYQTRQQAETDATTAGIDVEIVSTGLSLNDQTINGIAIVAISADVDPDTAFESATSVRRTDELIGLATAHELAERTELPDTAIATRFELSKAPLIVGKATHGPNQIDAVFRNDNGDVISNYELASRYQHDTQDVHFHPLGVLVERELYRPVTASQPSAESDGVGEPIPIATYRGSTSKPWQFGLTRYNGQLLLTQARAGPSKFDPVLKRFPIETQPLGNQPLVFSHTVSRRLWSEDPVNPHVQSQRSEGLRTQFLYNDADGWHLIQPKGLDTADDADSDSFESTQLDGVSVRSALLRSETDGEMKTTVEHEYRITPTALEVCERLYALSYYEANEESLDNLQWDIAEATAYDIVEAER